jgi:uncharacterized damage-inducible protein DinB
MGDATLRQLVYGKGAHVDPVACVDDVSAELAARKVAGYPHSIWQIVEHMNYWMDYELAKIAGKNPHYPDKATESWAHPEPGADGRAANEAWQGSILRFTVLLAEFARLAESDASVLEQRVQDAVSPQVSRESTVGAIVLQIVAHNSYHTGQIAMLRRQAGAWPPERGGDTW